MIFQYARATAISAVLEEAATKKKLRSEEKTAKRSIDRQIEALREQRRAVGSAAVASAPARHLGGGRHAQQVIVLDDEEDDLDDVRLLAADLAELKAPGNAYEPNSDSD